MASTVPRGAVRLEAEAAMGLDSVVTLARGLGTGGHSKEKAQAWPQARGGAQHWGACGPKATGVGLGFHQVPQRPW